MPYLKGVRHRDFPSLTESKSTIDVLTLARGLQIEREEGTFLLRGAVPLLRFDILQREHFT